MLTEYYTFKLLEKKYSIAITIDIKSDGSFAFLNNGLRQNVIFLYRLFLSSMNCKAIYLVNDSGYTPEPFPAGLNIGQPKIYTTLELPDDLDYFVVLGASVSADALQGLRQRGCATISYKAGNAGIISKEAVISGHPDKDGEMYYDADCYDAIWMSPHHAHTYKSWCETIYRCPVHIIPQIWDDSFFKIQKETTINNFGYKPSRNKWRCSIMDPNLTVMKTSHMPALVAECAYRKLPFKFSNIYITNAIRYRENAHFSSFIGALSAYKDGIMTVEDRYLGWEFLANHTDAVITHHWENGLNYLFYEVLYGNYPLIHNSAFLKDYGYYYSDFDAEDGARALIEAIAIHDMNLDNYRENNAKLLSALSPSSQANIELHENLLKLHKRAHSGSVVAV